MTTNVVAGWYNQYLDVATCNRLRRELLTLVHGQQDTAERLILAERRKNPGKSKRWYLEKVIYDLRRNS
jgi:hypothetical protein